MAAKSTPTTARIETYCFKARSSIALPPRRMLGVPTLERRLDAKIALLIPVLDLNQARTFGENLSSAQDPDRETRNPPEDS
jgi:hypothetical protein